jgi:uncharacterized protein
MFTTEQLSDQMTRDLFWIFSSPPLIKPEQFSFQKKTLDEKWLKAIEKRSEAINDFMLDKNLRMLGPYFEALWEFYFLNEPTKKSIAKNVQVFSGNRTVGEFDFIYLDKSTGEYRHLEVAIKYFLGLNEKNNRGDAAENILKENLKEKLDEKLAIKTETPIQAKDGFSKMSQWIGPNANDRLDKKYLKMLEQQSQLSKTPEGKVTLEALGVSIHKNLVKSEVCLLGYLFYPLDAEEFQPMLPPENSHAEHNKGYWIRASQLELLLPTGNLWKIIEKPFWMAPTRETLEKLYSRKEMLIIIKQIFLKTQRPLLISSFSKKYKSDCNDYESDNKYFVVSDSWPKNSASN